MHIEKKFFEIKIVFYFFLLCFVFYFIFFVLQNNFNLRKANYLYKNNPVHKNGFTKKDEKYYPFGIENNSEAKYYVFKPSEKKSTHKAVIICPGGGYQYLSYKNEGLAVGRWLSKNGITGIVLFYRMPNKEYHNIPLEDAQEMIKVVRNKSEEWNIDKNKIGIMGFSAGGHLAAIASNVFTKETRPDFTILYYPVITMDESLTNGPSKYNLLGDKNKKLSDYYSAEKKVTKKTPPAYIVYSSDDYVVDPKNSKIYYEALLKNKIPAKLTVYDTGDHGWGWSKKFKYAKENRDSLLNWINSL